jgi:four helix bundle protein
VVEKHACFNVFCSVAPLKAYILSWMRENKIENNTVLKLCLGFSTEIIHYCEVLISLKHFIVAKQLFRSATSIGANIMEAQNAESRADFIHKVKIAAKEADETQYWLIICRNMSHYPDASGLKILLLSIQKVINAILASSKKHPAKGV